jgi:2,4-diaminopentanoate dehydrogenase
MKKPFKIIVWGPGGIGGGCLREVVRLPEFELVGVFAYGASKVGKDAGELIGTAKTGVIVTNDRAAILALEADCVIYTALDMGDGSSDQDIVAILATGKNVVTSLAYHHLEFTRPDAIHAIEAACLRGQSSIHASGINPGFIVERLALLLTGLSNGIKHITIKELYETTQLPNRDFLSLFGFGKALEEARGQTAVLGVANLYLRQCLQYAGAALGVTFDDIEMRSQFWLAPQELAVKALTIPKGTVGAIQHSWVGKRNGQDFFTIECNWYMTRQMAPYVTDVDESWVVEIEGTPSLEMTLKSTATLASKLSHMEGDPTTAGLYASVAPLVQAIPMTCSAAPGRVPVQSVGSHWQGDLRS